MIDIQRLRLAWEETPSAEQHLKAWIDEGKRAAWAQPAEIKKQYRSASILKNRQVLGHSGLVLESSLFIKRVLYVLD